jgi:signal transduction histidine kinase
MKYCLILALLISYANGFSQSFQQKLDLIQDVRRVNCDSAFAVLNDFFGDYQPIDQQERGHISLQYGQTYYCLGNYEEALSNYQQAVTAFDTIKNSYFLSETFNLIGTLHKKQGDLELSETYFEKGLEVARAASDTVQIGNSLNNIGLIYFEREAFQQAKALFIESTFFKAKGFDTIGLSYNYDNLGQTYALLKKPDSALYYFQLASDYKQLIGEVIGYAIVQNNIGELLLRQGRTAEAEKYFRIALEEAKKVGYPDFEQYLHLMLSKVKEEKNNFKGALASYKTHVSIKDSLFNLRKSQQLSEIETRYQTEQKEQQIILQKAQLSEKEAQLNTNRILLFASLIIAILLISLLILNQNRLRKNQALALEKERIKTKEAQIDAAISSQEKERARYARDLHDGFGQMISILGMQLKTLDTHSKPDDRQQVFNESEKVIDEMYDELKRICFDLMPQTLIKYGITSALEEFAARINVAGKLFVETNFFGIDKRLPELFEISLYRISQEWLNNILKYSDAQKITVQLTQDGTEINLIIEDDGSGFDKNILINSSGNGWKNIQTRVNLIGGEMELDTLPGQKGNTFIVNAVLEQVEISEEAVPAFS